jgi:hypothetical protein
MPRYYFHLTNGKQVLDNHKGINLPGDAAARNDAVELARDLRGGAALPGRDWAGWFVAIVDEKGQKVDEVPIADA